MAYDDGVRIEYDTDNVLFQPNNTVGLTWSPDAVVPVLEPTSYTVNIGLYCFNESTNEWDFVVTLASDLSNTGSAMVTLPNPTSIPIVCSISIQITVAQAVGEPVMRRQIDGNVLDSILELGAIAIWGPIGYLARSLAIRTLCEVWCTQQPVGIGTDLTAQVEPCPTTAAQARADRRFEMENQLISGTFHPGSSSCFRQVVMNRWVHGEIAQSYFIHALSLPPMLSPISICMLSASIPLMSPSSITKGEANRVGQVHSAATILTMTCYLDLVEVAPLT